MQCVQEKIKNKKVDIHKLHHTSYNYITQITETCRILLLRSDMLLKYIIMYFSRKRCMISFHLKVKVAEDSIQCGIEDHTFGSPHVREHFFEEELTLGKTRLLEVDGLVE